MSNLIAIAIVYTWKWLIHSFTAVDEIRIMWLWLSKMLTQNFSMLLLLLSLIKILKLKFGRDSEAEFWCYLKAVILVKELYPRARRAIFNV